MTHFSSFIIIISIFAASVSAQIIGDEALQKIQSGQVSTLEGEFVAYLADTVSPDFVIDKFTDLGYELGFINIQPFTIVVANQPYKESLFQLTSQSEIIEFIYEPERVDTAFFRELLINQDFNEDTYETALERIIKSQSSERLFIRFDFSMNERAVIKFMTNYRSVAYEIISDFPRTVNILVEPGTERDVMLEIEKLPFVEYTALIGVIGE